VPVLSGQHQCPDQPKVFVATHDESAFSVVCGAAGRAIAFLDQFGLTPKHPIVVFIVEETIDNHGYPSLGLYRSRMDQIELMSYPSIRASSADPMMYGEPFDLVHYSGVVAHEVAHAVIQPYIKNRKGGQVPQEYLAHATQLATMPEDRRTRVIKAMKVGPWEGGDEISQMYLALSPGKFAVKSYLHLTTTADPDAWVQLLLNNNWLYVYVPRKMPRAMD